MQLSGKHDVCSARQAIKRHLATILAADVVALVSLFEMNALASGFQHVAKMLIRFEECILEYFESQKALKNT